MALLVLHIALGVYWSVTIPIWEAYDEIGHYYVVRYLATEHRLPPAGEKLVAENDEAHQPPLYYILAAIPVSFVDVEDGVEPRLNPYMWWGPQAGGWNRVVHDPAAEAWPYRGTVLAVHLARWVSVLLGAVALLCTFLAARLLAPERLWVRWGAVLILAFWPHFRFSTATINNDIMVTASAAAVTWLLVRLVVAERPRAVDVLVLLAASALTLLSKSNGLTLLPVVLVGLVVCALRAGPAVRRRLGLGLLSGLCISALALGWWYARNVQVGMGLFGGRRTLRSVGKILASLTGRRAFYPELLWPALLSGLHSLWANMGWGNIRLPAVTYQAAGLWALLGLAGLLLWLYRKPGRRQAIGVGMLSLLAASIIGAMLVFRVAWGNASLEGRYLLPALPALCILLALGWTTLLPERATKPGWALPLAAMAALALLTPALYLQPVYAAPRPIAEAQVAGYTPVRAKMGGFAELVGYRIEDRFVESGGQLRLELAWRTLAPTDADCTLAVQVFGAHRRLLGEVHRYPGHGTLATSTWQAGHLFAEKVVIPIEGDEKQGQVAWVEVSFYQHEGVRPVPAYDGEGRHLGNSLRLTSIKVRGTEQPAATEAPVGLRFGEAIWLTAGQAEVRGDAQPQLALDLNWACGGRVASDYTLSLQLRDGQNTVVAQVDEQPVAGAYPTSLWEAGEALEDEHVLDLPADLAPGRYTLYACLYDLTTMERLTVEGLGGEPLANGEVALLSVHPQVAQAPGLEALSPVLITDR